MAALSPARAAEAGVSVDAGLRVAIGAALAVIDDYSGAVWPASPSAPRQILLVLDDAEVLFCPEPAVAAELAAAGFEPLGRDALSGCETAARPRSLPNDLLTTARAVGEVPTVVVGAPDAVGWTIPDWTATLIHEHVHQMQISAPGYDAGASALGLAQAGEGGSWMIDYPFPYAAAAPGFRRLADAAAAVLAADDAGFPTALTAYQRERAAFAASLAPADARYLELQLWQEGAARWSEGAVVQAAGARWPYGPEWLAAHDAEENRKLQQADLALDRRAAFYLLGAAEAAMLERAGVDWRARYLAEPFAMGPYFPDRAPTSTSVAARR